MQLQSRTSVAKGEAISLESRCNLGCGHQPKTASFVGLRSNFQGVQFAHPCPGEFPTVSKSGNRNHCLKVGFGWGDSHPSACDQLLVLGALGDMKSCGDQGNNAETASTNLRQELYYTPLSARTLHWRDFRARLCSAYTSKNSDSNPRLRANNHWVHRIPVPEVGCVLVATNKLKCHPLLREAVIILLENTSRHWHGIILNKSMQFSPSTLHGINHRVLLDLAGCSKHIGGTFPLSSDIHVLTGRNHSGLRGFSTVIPGLSVGRDAAIPGLVSGLSAGILAKEDIHVYIGQVEWERRHLAAEIAAFEWWDVVACSSSVLYSPSSALWQNIRSHLALTGSCR